MTSRLETAGAQGILGLFTDLVAPGGVQEANRHSAASLVQCARRRGWNARFLGLNEPSGEHALSFDDTEISFRGFQRSKGAFTLVAIRGAQELVRGGGCIVLAGHPNLAPVAAAVKLLSARTKTIVVAHGVEVWERLPVLRRRALASADRVVAPSCYTVGMLAAVQGVPPERIQRLPWPLGLDFLRLADQPTEHPLPPDFPSGQVVLTVGRWAAAERYKGVDQLIHATATLREEFPDLHLVAVGSGDDLPRLREIATNIGVADRVHFLERLSREQIASCYARADIFALPSTGEGFGLVFLEAMAFGKPLVGAAAGGSTDLIADGVNGLLVPPKEVAQLTQALGRLLRNRALRDEMGRRGAAIVREKYRVNVFQQQLEDILAELARV